MLYDRSGKEGVITDLGICGELIQKIGSLDGASAQRIIY
jgi:hypothetical protein